MKKETIKIIQNWYQQNCNGDWEHNFGIKIESLDNPGWHVIIDLVGTNLEGIEVNVDTDTSGQNEWHEISIVDNKYIGVGSPEKLEYILDCFAKLVSSGLSRKDDYI